MVSALQGPTFANADGRQGTGPTRQFSDGQQRQLEQLKRIDAQVRQHELAHLRTGGSLVIGSAAYTYTYGPDGKAYATGGEVTIDTSPEKTPRATVDKGEHIQAAALAPADPSAQDYRVAALGAQMVERGRSEEAAAVKQAALPAQRMASIYNQQAAGGTGGVGAGIDTYA